MRIIHTSDWHLGQYFYGKSRADEHQKFLHWLIIQAQTHNVDAIIVAGDIFDTATPPSYARKMYFNFISELQALDCQLIILAGNHDSASMLAESKSLLSSLSTHVVANVTDVSIASNLSDQVFTLHAREGNAVAVICAVPYIRPRDVITSKEGQSAGDKSKSLQQAINHHYQYLYQYAKKLVKKSGLNLPIIATGHLTAIGASVSDSVREIYIGTLEALSSNNFPPADYIALGHIHRAQRVGKTEHIRYSGSPIPLSFDEAKQVKRVLMVAFKDSELDTITDLNVPCFQPLAMVKTSIENLVSDIDALVSEQQEKGQLSDSTLNKLWLDIELLDSDQLSDLQSKIITLVKDFPVEVLRVRREKQLKNYVNRQQVECSTLNELTLDEVFLSRLNQEGWLAKATSDQQQKAEIEQRKNKLHTLFKAVVAQTQEQEMKEHN